MSQAPDTSTEGNDIAHYMWPEHLSGQELRHTHPRGCNATITRVETEEIYNPDDNGTNLLPVIYFEEFERGLVANKTNLRWMAERYGSDADGWAGETVSLVAAKRSNGKEGIDIGDPFEDQPAQTKAKPTRRSQKKR